MSFIASNYEKKQFMFRKGIKNFSIINYADLILTMNFFDFIFKV